MSDRPGDPEGTDADTWSAWLPCFDATADTTSDTTGAASPGRGDPTAPVSSSAPVAPTPPGTPLPQSADPTVPPAAVPAQQSYPTPGPAAAPVTVGPAPRSH
ncbi:MAG: hypothetical protein JWP82_178, partial [Humibacillus sp.]|nr:hypothetical protein [Humibacillus sp.]